MARMLRSLAVMCFVATLAVGFGLKSWASADVILVAFQEPDAPKKSDNAKTKPKSAIKNKAATTTGKKKGNAKATMPAETDTTTPAAAASADGLKFSRDIAPILVANCGRCHNATHRSGFNLTSFEGLMKGGKTGAAVVASKPEESLLVQKIKAEPDAGPKMPPGQAQLADSAIAKIEQWVKEGSRLDAGVDPAAPMAKYAPTADDTRKAELAKMSPDERDKKTEAAGLDRLRKADPKAAPEMTKSAHFMLFAEMPKERATNLLKTMESEFTLVNRLLGNGRNPALNFPEKISLYVFKERRGFTEFVRTVENQEVDESEMARAKLNVAESPYLISFDPLNGGPEAAEPKSTGKGSSKKARTKKAATEEAFTGPERSVAGLLTEQLAAGALANGGKAPRWLTSGVGALIASKIEPRSPYYKRIRAEAADIASQGWVSKAQEALGNQTKPESVRAVGFAVGDFLLSNDASAFSMFVQKMQEGEAKLDEAIQQCLNGTRESFLNVTGEFVASRYGSGR